MPLLDHFRRPERRTPLGIVPRQLGLRDDGDSEQRRVAEGYFAEAQMHIGSRVEADVPTFEEEAGAPPASQENGGSPSRPGRRRDHDGHARGLSR